MPVPKKKRITPENALSTLEPSSPLPEQQEFHQHLRALAQSAVRTVLELVMREELDAFIGAAWGECNPKRRGYRNGTYTRESSDSDRSARGDHRAKTIGKVSSIPRPLNETFAMNRISRDQLDADVRGWGEHPQGGRSRPNAAGSRSKSPARSVGSTRASPTNLTRGGSESCQSIGVCSTWMVSISAFVTARRPMLPSF